MKITHNNIGQNLNLTDSTKADRAQQKSGAANLTSQKADALSSSPLGESSKVELSPRAQEAKRIKELALATPDVDQAKVAK